MRSIVVVLAGLTFASGMFAQSTCPNDGIVLYGQPSEIAAVGPTGAGVRALGREESEEAVLLVRCRDGYLIHASREGRSLSYSPSGCFHIFYGPHARIVSVDPGCDVIWDDEPHNYTETIRNGLYSIVYEGKLDTRVSAGDGLSPIQSNANSYILLRSSPADPEMRIHISTFDAPDGNEYKARNCAIAANLFRSQAGVTVDYWCELAPGRP